MLGIVTIVILIACAQALPSSVNVANGQPLSPPRLNIERRIARDGYYSESHNVITSDGYILEINRIPFSRFKKGDSSSISRPVVFLMHGLHNSAIAFITLGPNFSIAYTLADAGYDVWMGNARGIVNSRRHISLDPDDPKDSTKFFDYSFQDIGAKDLPAMLDYVLQVTKKKQLNYIGHSQGGTAFLVLNSIRPEYNAIFKSGHLLAAVGYQNHFPNRILKRVAQQTNVIYSLILRSGNKEVGFMPPIYNDEDVERIDNLGMEEYLLQPFYHNQKMIPFEILAGASIKQYAHFGQNIRDKSFRNWNYGTIGNLIAYGRLQPPEYDLRLVTANVTMHYTVNDILLDQQDVIGMAKVMPNTNIRRVPRNSFLHGDFVTAPDSKTLVTDYIIEQLNKKNK